VLLFAIKKAYHPKIFALLICFKKTGVDYIALKRTRVDTKLINHKFFHMVLFHPTDAVALLQNVVLFTAVVVHLLEQNNMLYHHKRTARRGQSQ